MPKKDPLRNRWYHLKEKCYKESSKWYPQYGGRGITICDEWKNDYNAFASWSMSHGYTEDKELTRKDPKGNFEPNNCFYATRIEQANVRSHCRFETYNGVTASVRELCRKFDKDYNLVRRRLQAGQTITQAMDEPRKKPYVPVSAKKRRPSSLVPAV